jgi:hypothetical protein
VGGGAVPRICNHMDCSHRDCSDEDCKHCTIWLMPQQYNTVQDLQDQESEIVELFHRSYACFTTRTSTDMHSRLPELKEQVLSLMSDHSNSITILINKMGMQHPIVIIYEQQHSLLEVMVSNFVEMVRLVSLHKNIEDILTRMTAHLTAQKEFVMHPSPYDLKDQQEQVLSLMSDHSNGITTLTNQLGEEHPLVCMSEQDHDSLEKMMTNFHEAVRRVQSTVTPAQSEESQLLASPASPQGQADWAIRAATQRVARIVWDLSTEITEVIEAININIEHKRAELYGFLPEMGKALSSLMENHSLHVRLVRQLASKIDDHGLAEEIMQEQA